MIYDLGKQGNPLINLFVDNLGVVLGLFVHELILISPIIYLSYKINEITNSNKGSNNLIFCGTMSYGMACLWEHLYGISEYLF